MEIILSAGRKSYVDYCIMSLRKIDNCASQSMDYIRETSIMN